MDTSCRIERIEIVSFGKLQNFSLDLGEGINLLSAPNESGKSTLAAFLRYAFYGFADARKKELAENDKRLYTPWDTPRAEGSVVVRKGGDSYRVFRSSVGTKETVEVTAVATGRPVFESEVPGVALFGVSEEVFSRTLFFRQLTVSHGKEKDGVLAEQLQNLAVSADEQVHSRQALDKLNKAKNELKGRGGAGWIPRLEQECARLEHALADAKRERADWEALSSERQALREKLEQSRVSCERTEAEQRNLERWDAKQKCEQLRRIRGEADRAREAYTASAEQARGDRGALTGLLAQASALDAARLRAKDAEEALFRAEQEMPPLRSLSEDGVHGRAGVFPVLLIAGLLLAAAGIAMTVLRMLFIGVPLLFAGIAAMVTGFVLRQRNIRLAAQEKERTEEAKRRAEMLNARVNDLRFAAERERASLQALESALTAGYEKAGIPAPRTFDGQLLTAQLQEALTACEERDRRKAAYESAETAASIAEEGIDLAALEALASGATEPTRPRGEIERELTFFRQQQKLLTEKEGMLRDQIAALEGKSADPALLAGKLEATERKLEECKRRYDVYEAARAGIEEAADRLKSMAAPRLGEIAGRYFSASTGGKYEGLMTDTQLAMRVRENGIERESEFLSVGTRDCAALSLRLALVDLLFDGAGMPILLDDAFGRLDDRRLEDTMRVLGASAELHQVLLLCCTDREEAALRNANVPYTRLCMTES